MIHLNEKWRENGYHLTARFFPEIYSCVSISDFKENFDEIEPTKSIMPPGLFCRGLSVVIFPNALSFSFRIPEEEISAGEFGCLSDLTGSMQIGLNKRSKKRLSDLFEKINLKNPSAESTRFYETLCSFNPAKNSIELLSYKEKGPLVEDKSREPIYSLLPVFSR